MEYRIDCSKVSEKQKQFFLSRKKHIGYGGARGGGKSWAARTKAKLLALNYSGIRILIVRRTFPELKRNHIEILKNETLPVATYNDKDKVLKFVNKSVIEFMYCQNDNDLGRLQGAEYDIIFIDEATQFTEYQLKAISACVRGVNNFPKRMYYTCNPGGIGHQYIKRIFIDRRYDEKENPEDYEFIPAKVYDNIALMESDPDYVQWLETLPPRLREMWLEGSWDVYEGQFFGEFCDDPEHYDDHKFTHVINPFEPDKDWVVYRSFDWGYNKPFSCAWTFIDHDGVAYRAIEYYGCQKNAPNEGLKMNAAQVFEEIHKIETQHEWLKGKNIIGVADPAIWQAQTGESVAETAAKHQVYFNKGDNQRIAGWMQCHYRLAFDENGYAMFYVFRNCQQFIRTIPLQVYSVHKPEDLDTEGEDHIADEFRYFCMSRPIKPRIKREPDPYYDNPAYTALNIPKEMMTKRRKRPKMEVISNGDI